MGPAIESMGFRVVRVLILGKRNLTLQIMVEPMLDSLMTVEDCANISRSVSAILDVEDPISGDYTLEVSSPGVERPLTKLEDFERFVDYKTEIELFYEFNGKKTCNGTLRGVVKDDVLIETDPENGLVRLPFSNISKAKLASTEIRPESGKGKKTNDKFSNQYK